MTEDWDESLPRVVGLLRAGLPPLDAWRRAGIEPPTAPTDAVGRAVAAADALAARTGAPLSAMFAAIAGAAADRREAAALREAALAGPRLSARVLAWLPLAGVALAAVVEPRTLRLLALTAPGWILLAAGAALTWAGRAWTRRIVRSAARAGTDDAAVTAAALLAAALDAGASVPGALRDVGDALDVDALRACGAAWARGQDARDPPEPWRALVRALRPAWVSGASAGPALRAAAEAQARRARADAAVAAAELGVRVALPLTLCLLPAFVLVGVVPLVLAVAGGVLTG